MCWNSTGKILAVAQTHQHRHWCHHIGSVTIYSYKDKKLLDGQAKKLNTESCVTSIKFHASSPSVLAAGTFTGDIKKLLILQFLAKVSFRCDLFLES